MTAVADPTITPAAVQRRILAAIDSGRLFRPRKYQADRLASESRFNLDLWSRQTGKSHTNAQDAVHLSAETGANTIILSASLDQTKELMLKVAEYAEVVSGVAGEIQREVLGGGLDSPIYVDPESKLVVTQTTITLPNGERIIGRPANARTSRGLTGHVKLDEFAMHEDQDEIFASVYFSILSKPHFRCDVMSTPWSPTDKFAQIVADAQQGKNNFTLRKVTIHDAIRDGLQIDVEELKRNLGDEDRFRREALCEFVEEASAFLTLQLIRGCESELIRRELPADPSDWNEQTLGWDPAGGDLYLGIDIGRRHDLTVLWLLQAVGDVMWTRACVELRNRPFREQQAMADSILSRLPVRRCCVDETGVGMQIAEELKHRHGGRVEPVTFTNKTKAAMAEQLRPRFQDRLIRVPKHHDIREDLHSVRRTTTAAGNVRYQGERTADGHADRFWALALANHATETGIDGGVIPWGELMGGAA